MFPRVFGSWLTRPPAKESSWKGALQGTVATCQKRFCDAKSILRHAPLSQRSFQPFLASEMHATPGELEPILARFPEAEELAIKRLFYDYKKTFFDTQKRKARHPVPLIIAGLIVAQYYAQKAGFRLDLSVDEKRILKKPFGIAEPVF
jgi:hypothetical protein